MGSLLSELSPHNQVDREEYIKYGQNVVPRCHKVLYKTRKNTSNHFGSDVSSLRGLSPWAKHGLQVAQSVQAR